MHILMAATATVRPQAKVPLDGRFEFQVVHCLPTAILPSGLYQPACSISHLMKVTTASIYTHTHTNIHEQNG